LPVKPSVTAAQRSERADQIFAAMLDGRSYAEIAAAEQLSVRRIQQIVRATLAERESDPQAAYRHVQIARMEAALRLIEREIAAGKVSAVPHLLKVLAMLNGYAHESLRRGPVFGHDDPRISQFAAALDQLDDSREAVGARLSQAAAREKLRGEEAPAGQAADIAGDSAAAADPDIMKSRT
jgi:hypothetical protein